MLGKNNYKGMHSYGNVKFNASIWFFMTRKLKTAALP
jgi:hypothetical protein